MIDLASIRNASFTLTPTGYNPEEVDRFLADLADQLAEGLTAPAAPVRAEPAVRVAPDLEPQRARARRTSWPPAATARARRHRRPARRPSSARSARWTRSSPTSSPRSSPPPSSRPRSSCTSASGMLDEAGEAATRPPRGDAHARREHPGRGPPRRRGHARPLRGRAAGRPRPVRAGAGRPRRPGPGPRRRDPGRGRAAPPRGRGARREREPRPDAGAGLPRARPREPGSRPRRRPGRRRAAFLREDVYPVDSRATSSDAFGAGTVPTRRTRYDSTNDAAA